MARYEEPPFPRGETFFLGMTINSSDLTNLPGAEYEGREYEVEDLLHGSGEVIRLKVVRNMNATAVKPLQALLRDTTDGMLHRRVNGVSDGTAKAVYVADEQLPSAGVPQYDLFYVVISGPVNVQLPVAGATVGVGDTLVSAAAGRVTGADFTGASTALAAQLRHSIGMACKSSTGTASDTILMLVGDMG